MSAQWILYSYVMAAGVALLTLILFRACSWYWHALSVAGGLAVGLVPPPSAGGGNLFYLSTGVGCVFLVAWGLGGPFFRRQAK